MDSILALLLFDSTKVELRLTKSLCQGDIHAKKAT